MRRLAIAIIVLALAGAARAESAADAARRKLAESHSGAGVAAGAATTETDEVFVVGAHFRGPVTRSFRNLGTGALAFKTLPHGHFSLTMEAHVKHPQNPELLECKVQREYRLEGKTIVKVSEHDWFNAAAAKHKRRFIDCVSLGYAVKWLTPRDDQGSIAPMRINLDQETYEITYVRKPQWLEATLRSGDGIVGRFFLAPAVGGVRPVDKFHIHSKDDLVVSFVRKGLDPEDHAK